MAAAMLQSATTSSAMSCGAGAGRGGAEAISQGLAVVETLSAKPDPSNLRIAARSLRCEPYRDRRHAHASWAVVTRPWREYRKGLDIEPAMPQTRIRATLCGSDDLARRHSKVGDVLLANGQQGAALDEYRKAEAIMAALADADAARSFRQLQQDR